MAPTRIGSLLQYEAEYGVVICRECQYAIQKSALESHLLKHKIYRNERQRLVSTLSQLELLEPDEVRLPSPSSGPIDGLPVIDGYRCTIAACGRLYASTIRIKRHCSEMHGNGQSSDTFSIARPAKLQTFFRGTKIRYFEVTNPVSLSESGTAPFNKNRWKATRPNQDSDNKESSTNADCMASATFHDDSGASLSRIDLDTLAYFHHFTTITGPTLPIPRHLERYWQQHVISKALQQRQLMCGLLSISALHLAFLSGDPATARKHCDQARQYSSDFFKTRDEMSDDSDEDEKAKNAAKQVDCILQCAFWTLPVHPLEQASFELVDIVANIRGLVLQNGESDGEEKTPACTTDPISCGDFSIPGTFGAFSSISAFRARLQELPSRMTEAFGRPDNVRDVITVLESISALDKSCESVRVFDDAGQVCQATAMWLTSVPLAFTDLVAQYNPPALVVLTYWTASLLKRAEDYGCWFWSGLAKTILELIARQLATRENAALGLVEDLLR
ncbi:hypothetical protein EJ04DRAFT_497248 [Polyplosphaeria fusca]|uniref:C2H2-type domain-containing protein n=1 Tax=Polyplosphaeria fusca TaxID=682080 RepID=A0A9P4QVW7_9PLEO|nr:hypothetical protein EJ04DRAFT_497248 [Polyplosphaeria fusca]